MNVSASASMAAVSMATVSMAAVSMAAVSMAAVSVRVLWAGHHTFVARQEAWHRDLPVYALWLMLDGSLEAHIDNDSWRVEVGQVFLTPPLASRRIYAPHGARWLTLGLQATSFNRLDVMAALSLPQTRRPDEPERALLESWMRCLAAEWSRMETASNVGSASNDSDLHSRSIAGGSASSGSVLMCEGLGRAVFGLCWRLWGDAELGRVLRDEAPAWIARTLERIEARPAVGVDELARAAGFSTAQFRRGFNRWTGQAPRDYLIRHRLETARQLLRQSRLPIHHVAREAGFSHSSHFTRAFAKTFAMTPSAYRQMEESPI